MSVLIFSTGVLFPQFPIVIYTYFWIKVRRKKRKVGLNFNPTSAKISKYNDYQISWDFISNDLWSSGLKFSIQSTCVQIFHQSLFPKFIYNCKESKRKKVLGSTVVKGSLSIFNPPHPHPNPYPPLFCFKDGAFESLWVLTLCVCFLQWTVAVIQTRDPTPHRPVSTTPWSTAAWLPKRYFIILFILVSQNFF